MKRTPTNRAVVPQRSLLEESYADMHPSPDNSVGIASFIRAISFQDRAVALSLRAAAKEANGTVLMD